jgi:hypothetical protein
MMLRIQRRTPVLLLLLFTVLSYCWVSIAADASLSTESALVPHQHSYSSSIDNSDSRNLADFEWDIVRKAGYPIFSFSNDTESEVLFKYSVSGTETGTYGILKYLRAGVYTADCISTANLPAILLQEQLTEADEYTVELDILQAFISDSDYYNQVSQGNATIDFCIRLDYVYDPADGSAESVINFHETNVTLIVDLTAGFSLTGIAVDRDAAEEASAAVALKYPVTAYFCDDSSVEIPPPTLSQGAVMQFCVEINENVTTSGVYVSDILSVDLDQSSGGVQHADIITDAVADWLTRKTCSAGICNIKTQLTSKWFAEIDPESMDITGTALLAFGNASRRRYLRVAFGAAANGQDGQQPQQQRTLQDSETVTDPTKKDSETVTDPIEELLGKFGLTVDLEGSSVEDDNRLGMIIVCVAASVAAILLCQIVSCCCCRNKVITKTTTTNIYDGDNAGVQSEPTFHPPPPLPSTFPRQQSPPALYSAPSFRHEDGNRSFAPQTQSATSFDNNGDSYDVTDFRGFTIATKVTPVVNGGLPLDMHAKNRATATPAQSDYSFHDDKDNYDDEVIVVNYDDEVMVVAVPIVASSSTTTKKRGKSRKSLSRHSSGSNRSLSRHSSGSDRHNRKSRKSSSRHSSGSDKLNRSDHSQQENGIMHSPKLPKATCQFVD